MPSEEDKGHLLATQCQKCGEIAFPKTSACRQCQSTEVKEYKLSRKGKIYSLSTIYFPPPPTYYKGPVPFSIGWVELPNECRVLTPFIDAPVESFKIGDEVELSIRKIDQDAEGNEVLGFGFAPAAEKQV